MDVVVSSFRIVSPTSFVYGESVAAANFIQLEDLPCHFQPLNVTLQVPTLADRLCHGDPREGPLDVSADRQLEGQAISRRHPSQPGGLECGVCVSCELTRNSCLPWLVLCCVDPLAFQHLEEEVHVTTRSPPGAEAQAGILAQWPQRTLSVLHQAPIRAGQPRGFATSPSSWVLRATRCGLAIQGTAFLL